MKKETAERIVAYIGEDAVVYEGYSGRGMYGKTTFAVVAAWESDLIEACAELGYYDDEDDSVIFSTDILAELTIYY